MLLLWLATGVLAKPSGAPPDPDPPPPDPVPSFGSLGGLPLYRERLKVETEAERRARLLKARIKREDEELLVIIRALVKALE